MLTYAVPGAFLCCSAFQVCARNSGGHQLAWRVIAKEKISNARTFVYHAQVLLEVRVWYGGQRLGSDILRLTERVQGIETDNDCSTCCGVAIRVACHRMSVLCLTGSPLRNKFTVIVGADAPMPTVASPDPSAHYCRAVAHKAQGLR